ncbi:MAG: UDP-N-acetylmuramate--L-alanine ligase [Gammaproteobacteria bacterium TMED226]|nr:MAG: UDP-N-acetylmuramate--L-alanine ligase [Gammaproteobacteria bacterium TMED226]|tara:strand:- start:16368 stop:17762 length:1395 start_codon:yes stop_codon:yes gene_type:complete
MKLFKKVKRIHFVGIGGAGMIGIARVLLKKGYKISGSDIIDSDDLKKLREDGAKVSIGHLKENIKGSNLVVVSSAIDKSNPEIIKAKKDSITIIPRAEMLGSIMIGYESIAVAGSHGKTTTTSMIAKILSVANLSPTYVVGGKVLSTDENSDLGEGKYLVAEADESDGTFTHLQPDVAVLTNIDDDHLVHYNNIFDNLLDSFVSFSENVPFYGYLLINSDDKNIKKISKRISRTQISFGESKKANYQIINIEPVNGRQNFEIFDKKNNKNHKFKLNLPGRHNVFNAAASIGVAMEEGIPISAIKKGISEFSGVSRRYEKHNIKINQKKIVLIDDYGHHPLEIDSNINAYREEFPNKKVCMIFQPHRFSRTAQLFDDFIRVLNKTDSLILLDIYSASEKPIRGIHSRTIAESIKQMGHKDVTYLKSHDDVIDLIMNKIDSFDIVVTQGAGSISKVCESIKDKWAK